MNEEEGLRLCHEALAANDPDTLTQIILDINRMLYLKQRKLKDIQLDSELQIK
jgi:hypothetical protein